MKTKWHRSHQFFIAFFLVFSILIFLKFNQKKEMNDPINYPINYRLEVNKNRSNCLNFDSGTLVNDEQIFLLTLPDGKFLAISSKRAHLDKATLPSSFLHFPHLIFKNEEKKDFLEFDFQNRTRIMPKFLFSSKTNVKSVIVELENHHEIAKFWRYSRKIECKNIVINRGGPTMETIQISENKNSSFISTKETFLERMRRIVTEKPKKDWGDWRRKIPLEAFGEIVHLRDLIITHNMTPFLFFGSLLGWYRECSIITHTQDFDFGIRVIEMNENFLKAIETIEAPFWAERRLGLRNESLEYTVKSLKYHFPVDIFFLYDTDNFTYAAGQSPGLTSYRFSWPKIVDDEICAGELFNHFFYVPCEIDRHIVHEFGAEWKKDRPSRHFSWSSGAKNSKIHKRYPKFMRKQVEKFY